MKVSTKEKWYGGAGLLGNNITVHLADGQQIHAENCEVDFGITEPGITEPKGVLTATFVPQRWAIDHRVVGIPKTTWRDKLRTWFDRWFPETEYDGGYGEP